MEYCYDCDKDVKVIKKIEVREVNARDKKVKVKIECHYCPFCHNELINETIDDQLSVVWGTYLSYYDLAFSSFKDVRTSLGLSQELFASCVGFSKRSVIRYENGDEVPSSKILSIYAKLNKNKDYILECINDNKDNISDLSYDKILRNLKLNIGIKERNALLYLLCDNPLYVMGLIKNMFAADFLNYKKYDSSISDFKYIKMGYGPVIDNYKDIINSMLKTGEIKIEDIEVIDGVERFKYIAVWDINKSLFTKEELETLETVKKKFKGKSSKNLSDWSHKFDGWIKTPLGKVINYKYAKDINI